MKKIQFLFVFLFLYFSVFNFAQAHSSHTDNSSSATPSASAQERIEGSAIIFYNEACADCAVYLKQKLIPLLESYGLEVEARDYINEKTARQELLELNTYFGIPFELQSHIAAFVKIFKSGLTERDLILGGHVPLELIMDIFARRDELPDPVLIFQDVMLEMGNVDLDKVQYAVWSPGYEAQWYGLQVSIDEYARWIESAPEPSEDFNFKRKSILPLVLTSGFIDGINPCAFAVLLFFIAFLFALRRTRGNILWMGATYILGVYLAYLGIGLGLFKALTLAFAPHLMAKVGAYLTITLGVISLTGELFPKSRLHFGIPSSLKLPIKNYVVRATFSASFIAGILVGLCTFPCSGGIYVGIIGLLGATGTFMRGLSYLLIYNIMFVLPLIIFLALATNKFAVSHLEKWEQSKSRLMHLISSIIMIILGLSILVFFT